MQLVFLATTAWSRTLPEEMEQKQFFNGKTRSNQLSSKSEAGATANGLHWVGKVQLKAAVLRFPWKNGILKAFSAGTGQDYFSISPFLF